MPGNKVSRRPLVTGQGGAIAQNIRRPKSNIRAREPITRSFGMIRGKFPSQKIGRMVHWESQMERDAVFLFEFSPGVISYREQPLTTHYSLDGKVRRYTPDFEVILFTGEILLIEVKPTEKLRDPKEHQRFERITKHFEENGQIFRILTEREIRQPELLENLRMLVRHRGKKLSQFERRTFLEKLTPIRSIAFADAITILGGATTVWNLIDERLLFCSLGQPVTEQTILSTTNVESSNEELYF